MKPGDPLYIDDKHNTLLNDVFFYVLHHLPKLQNMHDYRVDADTDITDFVNRKFVELEGPPHVPYLHLFSKNLLACMETLVAFCPCYKAANPRMAGKMETFFQQAVVER